MANNLKKAVDYSINSFERFREIAEKVLSQAKNQGATQAEVSISQGQGFTVSIRKGEVETVEHNRDKGMSLTVYYGQQKGSASTTDLDEHEVIATVNAACDIAKVTDNDPYAGLAEPSLMAFDYPDLKLYHPWDITPEQAIKMGIECESKAMSVDKRIFNSEGASVGTHNSSYMYGNSHGFIGHYASSRHSISCCVLAKESNGNMQRDFDYTISRDAKHLANPQMIGNNAGKKAIARLGGCRVKTCQAPVLFDAPMAKSLWGSLITAISGGHLYRKASFLVDHLDKTIFPAFIRVYQIPHLEGALGSAPFDLEGVMTHEQDYITQGILKRYVLSSYSARKLDMTTTGNSGGVFNLRISDTGEDKKALLKKMEKGLFVTELMGTGINLVTGDYSRGASGFWVENGEIQFPVEEITIAGNLKNMFQQIIAVGKDVDTRGNICTGSLLIENMTIAGE